MRIKTDSTNVIRYIPQSFSTVDVLNTISEYGFTNDAIAEERSESNPVAIQIEVTLKQHATDNEKLKFAPSNHAIESISHHQA